MKVFLRGETPENIKEAEATEEKYRSWFKVPKNYRCKLVYVDTKFKEIKRINREKNLKQREEESPVIDMPTYERLGNIIKNHSEKIYACFTNVISIGISKVRCVGDEIRAETCITLYCLDKNLIPFGEKALPESLEGYPCDVREDIVMFGMNNCPNNCPARDKYLPEPGCSIGIKEKDSSGSVGFLVESQSSANSFLNGFLTASHVVVEDFAEYYNNNFLSKHEYPFRARYIVHPSYQDDARKSHEVGTVVESFFGEYKSASIDVALVQTKERVTKDSVKLPVFNEDHRILNERLTATKTGRTTGKTTGLLKCSNHSVKITLPFSRSLVFCNCYVVENLEEKRFFLEGDSGAGVYVKDNDTTKPLGIAIAFLSSFTVVSKIDRFIEKLDLSIISENPDSQVQRLYSRLGNIALHEDPEQMECA